ncbi:MAG: hypothetical protein WC045_02740 [Patescibacteria group bacterium]
MKKLLISFLLTSTLFVGNFAYVSPVFAVDPAPTAPAPIPAPTDGSKPENLQATSFAQTSDPQAPKFGEFIQVFYRYLSIITLIAALLSGIIGSYMYMTSSGNPEKIGKAREIIVNSIIAIIVVAFAYAFFNILSPNIIGK